MGLLKAGADPRALAGEPLARAAARLMGSSRTAGKGATLAEALASSPAGRGCLLEEWEGIERAAHLLAKEGALTWSTASSLFRALTGTDAERAAAAAERLFSAEVARAEKGGEVLYVKPVWRLVMLVIRHIPEAIFKKLNF